MERRLHSLLSKTCILVFLVFGLNQSFAQAPKIQFEAEESLSEVKSNSMESTRLHIAFEGMNYLDVETREGNFTELFVPGAYHTGALGTPKLPASKKLIEIPFGAEVDVKVLDYTIEEYRLSDLGVQNQVMPVQPAVRKDQDVLDIPFEYKADTYSRSDFISPELAVVEELGVMRSIRLGRLVVSPVHYNPAEGKIRVYNNIEIEIRYEGADMSKSNRIKASTYSPFFEGLYDQVINPFGLRSEYEDYPDLTKYPTKMVLVSHPDFETTLQPFIEWKTKQGIEVIEAYTDDIGGSVSDIQDFIQDQYDQGTPEDPAPTFITLVGDSDKLPASTIGSASGKVTDLYYASVDGDYFPDMYYGRLSARNVQELQNQLDKILYYQQYEFDDPSYLDDVTLIAGADWNWNSNVAQPTVIYGTDNYFNASNGFANVNDYLDSYSGVYDEERIAVSMINYTAHCSPTSWGDPNLSVNDVHNMTNTNQYPVAIGNCCLSSQFSHSESIGEAWVRAEEKGGVAYVGSAPNTYWFEDFYWAVGAFPISGNNNGYVPTTDETSIGAYDAPFVSDYKSVASIKFVGNLAVTEAHMENFPTHSGVQYYWEAYHTFGDPSTSMYLTQGEDNNVTHLPTVPIGVDTYNVEAVPGSYVAISKDGVLHGAAYVDESGSVDVPIEPITDGGDATIVVTRPQYIPYVAEIPAAALEGPYVTFTDFVIDDAAGNDNGEADFGEEILLDITLENVGNEQASDVNATLLTDNEYVTITNDSATFDDIDEESSATLEGAFSVAFSDSIPDQESVLFTIEATDGEDTWESNFTLHVNAPHLVFEDIWAGDPDKETPINPGELTDLTVSIRNEGHAASMDIESYMEASSSWLTVHTVDAVEASALAPDATTEVTFEVSTLLSTPPETVVELLLTAVSGEYAFEGVKEVVIGEAPVYSGGDIPTTYNTNPTTSSNAVEPGEMSVTIPEGA
ncbi:MAG: C25 family cysteine peptidase, partial [Bacteroidales bacterium]